MKRLFSFLFIAGLFMACSLPVFASDLAFDPYIIDYAPYSSDAVNTFGDAMGITFKSIGNTGLLIFAVTASVALIQVLFEVLVMRRLRLIEGVRHREFNRKVKAEDFRRNYDDIVEDKVRDMQVSYEARKIFQRDHADELFNDGLRRLQDSFAMRQAFTEENNHNMVLQRLRNLELRDDALSLYAERHPDADVQHRLQGMETRDTAAALYAERHPDADVQHRLQGMETRDTATALYAERHPDADIEHRVQAMDARRAAVLLHHKRNPDAAAYDRVLGMTDNDRAHEIYRQSFPDSELEENVRRREVSARGEMAFHDLNPDYYGERKDYFKWKAAQYYESRK